MRGVDFYWFEPAEHEFDNTLPIGEVTSDLIGKNLEKDRPTLPRM